MIDLSIVVVTWNTRELVLECLASVEREVRSLAGKRGESSGPEGSRGFSVETWVVDNGSEDGTAEAIYVDGAPGFSLGVQWHPEYNATADPVSRALFQAFGEALRDWSVGKRPGRLKTA